MNTTSIELHKIYDLAYNVLKKNGCDKYNAECVATTERKGGNSSSSKIYISSLL